MWSGSEENKELGHWKKYFFYCGSYSWFLNIEADQEWKKSELRTEWKLHESIFGYIQKYLDSYPSVDLFASRINAQLLLFLAYRPDPKAEVINAFCVSWHNLPFYCFSLFSCRWKVLQKIISDNGTGILIVPNWQSQFWLTALQDLLLTEAFIIPPDASNLYLPNQFDLKHPFLGNLKLMPCLVSRKGLASSWTYPVGL